MTHKTKINTPYTTIPLYLEEARHHALELSTLDSDTLGRLLRVNNKLAAENLLRYKEFFADEPPALPAILSYTGMVFKRLHPADFTPEDFLYAQEHLRITSFLYGLLRPLDAIKNYRLEGDVRLAFHHEETMFRYWQSVLTDRFIEEIRKQGGVLINLASAEMQHLFDWQRIQSSVRVISPEFVTYKNGKATTVVIYAKMCRGEMTRFIIKNRIDNPEDLTKFSWEGFEYSIKSSENNPVFELK